MYPGVKRLAADFLGPERELWLSAVRACYDATGDISGPFAKQWVRELDAAPFNLKRLERYGILEKVSTSRRGHRAYWKMVDREGVGRALKELGYL